MCTCCLPVPRTAECLTSITLWTLTSPPEKVRDVLTAFTHKETGLTSSTRLLQSRDLNPNTQREGDQSDAFQADIFGEGTLRSSKETLHSLHPRSLSQGRLSPGKDLWFDK